MQKLTKDLIVYHGKDLLRKINPGRPFRPEQSYILLIRKGLYEIRYNLVNHLIDSNCILFLNKNTIYEFVEIDLAGEAMVIAINSSFDSISAIKIRNHQVFQLIPQTQSSHFQIDEAEMVELWLMAELLKHRLDAKVDDSHNQQIIHHLFLSMVYTLAGLSEKYNRIKIHNLSGADRITIEYLGLLFRYIKSQKTVMFYASEMGITAKHLSETVKQSSGFTAGQIIDLTLMAEAKILLANPDNNINKTARELGFSDQYSFSKFFKRMTGKSPTDYLNG